MKKSLLTVLVAGSLTACTDDLPTSAPEFTGHAVLNATQAPSPTVALGKLIYNNATMSRNNNQSCASCHAANSGFAAPSQGIVSQQFAFFEGSIAARFGDRKPPSSAYSSFSPVQRYTTDDGYVGGLFWDGRAKGSATLTPIQEQVLGPFLADKEHAFSPVCILWEINRQYPAEFNAVSPTKLSSIPFAKMTATNTDVARNAYCHTGTADLPYTPASFSAAEAANLHNAYTSVGIAVGAFESSAEVNRFSSKWDDVRARRATFTAEERAGERVFDKSCKNCHSSSSGPEVFNDHEFYNLGLPRHPLRRTLVDRGLGAVVNNSAYNGFFRNVTVRNVNKRAFPGAPKTFMHNGVLTSLESVVHFYNTRDVKACPAGMTYGSGWVRFPTAADPATTRTSSGVCWPAPDFPATKTNKRDIGRMRLTPTQERAVVAYLRTMTDR
jgi:cytochrome c peroxidase